MVDVKGLVVLCLKHDSRCWLLRGEKNVLVVIYLDVSEGVETSTFFTTLQRHIILKRLSLS